MIDKIKDVKKKKATVKNKAGRPKTDYTEQKKIILDGLINGQSLRAICRADGMPSRSTIFTWCKDDAEFSDQYARAHQFQADYYADMILDQTQTLLDRAIAGEAQPHEVSATSIFVDSRKWITARQAPKKYGKLAELQNEDGDPIREIKITIENPVDLRKKIQKDKEMKKNKTNKNN